MDCRRCDVFFWPWAPCPCCSDMSASPPPPPPPPSACHRGARAPATGAIAGATGITIGVADGGAPLSPVDNFLELFLLLINVRLPSVDNLTGQNERRPRRRYGRKRRKKTTTKTTTYPTELLLLRCRRWKTVGNKFKSVVIPETGITARRERPQKQKKKIRKNNNNKTKKPEIEKKC